MEVMEDSAGDGPLEDPLDMPPSTMLEHPVFVHWCVSCGLEAPEDAKHCPRCAGLVRRHQRVLELPDEDPGPLSLASLKAALADVSASQDVGASAVLLSEQGPDPGVSASHPELARELAALGVPPAVQRALVNRGFVSLDQITAAARSSAPGEGALAVNLGLSPAAEVLLRRLWHTAADRRDEEWRAGSRRRPVDAHSGPLEGGGGATAKGLSDMASSTDVDDLDDEDFLGEAACDALSAKRLRFLASDGLANVEDMVEDDEDPPDTQGCDSRMQAIQDRGLLAPA